MKKTCFLVLITCISATTFSQRIDQSVISSAGDISKSAGFNLEWTLGEIAVETSSAADKMYTQGFHQPLLITKLKAPLLPLAGFTVSVFPNPVPAMLNISIRSSTDSKVNLKMHNVKGHLVYTGSTYTKGSSVQINMLSLAAGVYILTVTNSSGIIIGTYKVVKAS
jgi:hypothetical protein